MREISRESELADTKEFDAIDEGIDLNSYDCFSKTAGANSLMTNNEINGDENNAFLSTSDGDVSYKENKWRLLIKISLLEKRFKSLLF